MPCLPPCLPEWAPMMSKPHAWWAQLGKPGADRWQFTITPNGQRIELDGAQRQSLRLVTASVNCGALRNHLRGRCAPP